MAHNDNKIRVRVDFCAFYRRFLPQIEGATSILSGEKILTQRDDRGGKSLVLDTSAFIAGFDPFAVTNPVYTVPAVRQELTSNSMIYTRFRTAIDSGKLQVRKPTDISLAEVDKSSEAVGDIRFLSEVDKQVLALALQLKGQGANPMVVTDDYSMQNVSNQLGLEFAPLMTFGIRYRLNWIIYCPACHRQYPVGHRMKACQACGTQLKRKALRKTPLR